MSHNSTPGAAKDTNAAVVNNYVADRNPFGCKLGLTDEHHYDYGGEQVGEDGRTGRWMLYCRKCGDVKRVAGFPE